LEPIHTENMGGRLHWTLSLLLAVGTLHRTAAVCNITRIAECQSDYTVATAGSAQKCGPYQVFELCWNVEVPKCTEEEIAAYEEKHDEIVALLNGECGYSTTMKDISGSSSNFMSLDLTSGRGGTGSTISGIQMLWYQWALLCCCCLCIFGVCGAAGGAAYMGKQRPKSRAMWNEMLAHDLANGGGYGGGGYGGYQEAYAEPFPLPPMSQNYDPMAAYPLMPTANSMAPMPAPYAMPYGPGPLPTTASMPTMYAMGGPSMSRGY